MPPFCRELTTVDEIVELPGDPFPEITISRLRLKIICSLPSAPMQPHSQMAAVAASAASIRAHASVAPAQSERRRRCFMARSNLDPAPYSEQIEGGRPVPYILKPPRHEAPPTLIWH